MGRYLEYGALSAAILTLIYLVIAFITDITVNLQTVGICVAGGILTGLFVGLILYRFSPGEPIPEGEEDLYIKKQG